MTELWLPDGSDPITIRNGGRVYTLRPGESEEVPDRLVPLFLARGASPEPIDAPDDPADEPDSDSQE